MGLEEAEVGSKSAKAPKTCHQLLKSDATLGASDLRNTYKCEEEGNMRRRSLNHAAFFSQAMCHHAKPLDTDGSFKSPKSATHKPRLRCPGP